jgi:hypothetical protein
VALDRRRIWTHRDCRLGLAHRIEQLGPGKEHDPGAGQRQHPATDPRIGRQIMLAALDRADRNCIDYEPRFEAGLDREQATDFAEHGPHLKSLNTERANTGFEPFKC